ncbi:MAG: hypothetical protein AB7F35_06415 [Acetobacteraceae bacterium]
MQSIITVTTASDTYDLTTVATVRDEIGDAASSVTDDIWIRWIHQESRRIAVHCNRVFAQETVSEVFRLDGQPARQLKLTRYPVTTLTSVTEGDDAALAATYYELDGAAGLLYRLDGDDGRRCWDARKLTVVYTGGYELLSALPHDIETACIQLVVRRFTSRGRDPFMRSQSIPGVGEKTFWVPSEGVPGLPPDIVELLAPYRNYAL